MFIVLATNLYRVTPRGGYLDNTTTMFNKLLRRHHIKNYSYLYFRCEEECPKDEPCPERCRCQNGGECTFVGTCDCPSGWTGEVCANKYVEIQFSKGTLYFMTTC